MNSTAPNSNQNTELENNDYDEKEIVNIVRNGSRLLLRRDPIQAILTCIRQPSLSGWKSCEFTTKRERLVFYLQGRRQRQWVVLHRGTFPPVCRRAV
jgi:hypothetical protein